MIKTLALFDLPMAVASKSQFQDHLLKLASEPEAASVVFANAHVIAESSLHLEFLHTLQRVTVIVPDGTPVAWTMNAVGATDAVRYSGPDLMIDLISRTLDKTHFFLGSTPEVLAKMKAKFPGSKAHFYSPPYVRDVFSEEELQKQTKLVQETGADFIWVGLGAPKQERHVVAMAQRSKRGVWLAVGAAFDFYAETKPRAPQALQRAGLEWAFRMFTEPRRLAIRYIKTNPIFIKLALREIATHKRR